MRDFIGDVVSRSLRWLALGHTRNAIMEEAFSIPPLSKVRLLCVHYGIAFEGQPAISDIAGFATAFKEDVNVDDLFFDTNVSQAI